MNKLNAYIELVGYRPLADKLGVTVGLISHWRTGRRIPSPVMARKIEEVSGKMLKREDIRPDIFG